MTDIINDLSTLTTIPYVSLERLVDLSVACISHSIEESLLDDETYTVVDIGVGRLSIKVEDNTILYKFIPSTKLLINETSIYSNVSTIVFIKINPIPKTNSVEIK